MSEKQSGAANPDLLWSAEKLHAALGSPGLSIVDTRQTEAFAAGRIPGARLHVFARCGHLPPMEVPQETTAVLRDWLQAS